MGIIFVMSYVGLPLDIFKAVPNIPNILSSYHLGGKNPPFHSNLHSHYHYIVNCTPEQSID